MTNTLNKFLSIIIPLLMVVSTIVVFTDNVSASTTTNFNFSTDSKDLAGSSAIWSTARDASTGTVSELNTIQTSGVSGPLYNIDRGIIIIDTSSIPSNAIITSASINLYVTDTLGTRTYTIQAVTGTSNPIVAGDYLQSKYSGDFGSKTGGLSNNAWANIPLTSYSIINKGGISTFGLRTTNDIANTQPTPVNYGYMTFNPASSGTNKPYLTVTYDVPVPTWKPTFTNSPQTELTLGNQFEYIPSCNESVTYDIVSCPESTIWANNTMIYLPHSVGEYNFSLKATSVAGSLSEYLNWTLVVNEAPILTWGPFFETTPQINITVNELYNYIVQLNETSTVSAIDIPSWAIFYNDTLILNGIPEMVGTYNFSLMAISDLGSGIEYQNWTVEVTDIEEEIIIPPIPEFDTNLGYLYIGLAMLIMGGVIATKSKKLGILIIVLGIALIIYWYGWLF